MRRRNLKKNDKFIILRLILWLFSPNCIIRHGITSAICAILSVFSYAFRSDISWILFLTTIVFLMHFGILYINSDKKKTSVSLKLFWCIFPVIFFFFYLEAYPVKAWWKDRELFKNEAWCSYLLEKYLRDFVLLLSDVRSFLKVLCFSDKLQSFLLRVTPGEGRWDKSFEWWQSKKEIRQCSILIEIRSRSKAKYSGLERSAMGAVCYRDWWLSLAPPLRFALSTDARASIGSTRYFPFQYSPMETRNAAFQIA